MKMHYLQHVPFETPANIRKYFTAHGHGVEGTHVYRGEVLPDVDDFDCLVIMGGPMGVYEEEVYPWLKEEKKLIRHAIDSNKKVLGICLGAQLIAEALDAGVYPGPQIEIGWYPVKKSGASALAISLDEEEVTVFHWHGDTFDLPKGAELLFESTPGIKQGFSYTNHVLALQFHLEMTKASVVELVKNAGNALVEAPYIQDATTILTIDAYYKSNEVLLNTLLTIFLSA